MTLQVRRHGWLAALLLCLAAGWAHALSIAAPWDGQPRWWLQLLSLALLAALVGRSSSVRTAALRGWAFGLAWLTGTFWWLFISMHTYGGLPALLAVLAVVGLAAVLALYYAAACAASRYCSVAQPVLAAAVWAAAWLLAEFARGMWFTGFPWGAAGYAHVEGPLAAFAPWTGVYGIHALSAFVASLLASLALTALAWRSGPPTRTPSEVLAPVVSLIVVGLLAWQLGALPQPQPSAAMREPLGVTLLQGNIPQDEKFQSGTGVAVALAWYGDQLRAARTPLVVAPETALPLLPQQLPPGYLEALRDRFGAGEQTALIGIPLGNARAGYRNAAVGLQPGREAPYEYAKHHLVPFGEFIPPLFRWFTEMMDIPLGDFNRGDVGQPSMALGMQRLAPNICYEDLFGEELGARFADPGAAPTIFVNLSNIGWFGDTVAIDQHLGISRMRTLEFHRPMIRATNTGPTVIIDAQGRVTQSLPRLTRGVLTGEVQGRDDITPYAAWVSRLGLAPLWLAALVIVAWAMAMRRRAR